MKRLVHWVKFFAFRSLRSRTSPKWFHRLINTYCRISGRKYRIFRTEHPQIYLCDDGNSQIYFCRQGHSRLYLSYELRGGEIGWRVQRLSEAYNLDKIRVNPPGTFIDCGANVGELGLWARANRLEYIPFEPEPLEALCCDLNNFDGNPMTRRMALWKEDTLLTFYSKPESADSSAIDQGGAIPIEVYGITLDNAVNLTDASGTIILKVEAEGAEPEVLEGATMTLPMIDFVAVDCGPERYGHEFTFIEVNAFLQDRGFRLIEFNPERFTFLYQNTRRQSRQTK